MPAVLLPHSFTVSSTWKVSPPNSPMADSLQPFEALMKYHLLCEMFASHAILKLQPTPSLYQHFLSLVPAVFSPWPLSSFDLRDVFLHILFTYSGRQPEYSPHEVRALSILFTSVSPAPKTY